MSDFSAATIARLIPLGLARQGIEMPAPSIPNRAHIALDWKRSLLTSIAQTHGEQTLARIGEGVFDLPDEPAASALLPARDPADLFARWQRLERYFHSKHRIEMELAGAGRAVLGHRSIRAGTQPTRFEDLLILGLLVGLLERIGARRLRARVRGETRWRYEDRKWTTRSWPETVSSWEFDWDDAVVDPPRPTQPAEERDAVTRARQILSGDLGRGWTIARLAADMNLSSRSLQRRLAQGNSGFTVLLAQARASNAARLLGTSTQAAAQIGYLCGYSDQAHFNREFRRQVGCTPLQFRAGFAG